MDFSFADFIRIWVRIALVLVFVEAYLTVNKIWIRKHEAVVSESVSVSAQILALVTGIPFVVLYWLEGAYEGAISDGLFLLVNLIMILIGIGFWVKGRRPLGFWQNLKKSLRLERTEASVMVKDIFRPVGARKIIRILHELALIDNELDEREVSFIRAFARNWNIDVDAHLAENPDDEDESAHSFTRLRGLVKDYLAMSPPIEQARQLRDLLSLLINVDKVVSAEEQLMMVEFDGLIDDYIGGTRSTQFNVFIAPQNSAQEQALTELLAGREKERRLGGDVFRVGRYYSVAYADMVCDWYRAIGYLTVAVQRAQRL